MTISTSRYGIVLELSFSPSHSPAARVGIGQVGMTQDVYQPCPYCTDKKIKFCCADIADDMSRISRQVQGGQQRTALKRLEKLADSHPDTVWNELTRASLLFEEDRGDEALAILEHLQSVHPDHSIVTAMYAIAYRSKHGYDAAREPIWRALRKNQGTSPVLTGLLRQVTVDMMDRRCFLAARQYLSIAMRLAHEQDREDIFNGLMAIDGGHELPYPIRGVHTLRTIEGDADRADRGRKAHRLAERGCFGPAARRYDALAESDPRDAAAHYNAALSHAWAGDQSIAADAFLRAAKEESDFELAAEYAALGQILRALDSDDQPETRLATFRIDSRADVEKRLEERPECVVRMIDPRDDYVDDESDESNVPTPTKVFEIVDRPVPESLADIALADCPRTRCFCTIEPADEPGGPPILRVSSVDTTDFDNTLKFVAGLLGRETPDEESSSTFRRFAPPGFRAAVDEMVTLPPGTPAATRRRIYNEVAESIAEHWLSTPQELLGGDTPEQAATNPDRHVELAGLLYLLDVVLFDHRTDVGDAVSTYRERLGLPARTDLTLNPDDAPQSLSTIQMLRLNLAKLEDRQLSVVKSRAILIRHWAFLDAVLQESLGRAQLIGEKVEILMQLSQLARERNDTATALHWIGEAKHSMPSNADGFMERVQWDLLELNLRLDEGNTPETQSALRTVLGFYGPKIPDIVPIIAKNAARMGVELPAIPGIDVSNEEPEGIWTPDQDAASSQQKLWLPGA